LLASTQRRQTATAEIDSEVMLIRRTLFVRMLAEFPDLAQKLHEDMSMELRQLTDEASALVARSNNRLRR
jgi:CRP-like cAMP-binding protein